MQEHERHCVTAVDKAIRKYGIGQFAVEVIDQADNICDLNDKEKYWIAFYGSMIPKGYNQCCGGDNTCGYVHKVESKQKMSCAKAKLYIGKGNPFYGKTHTEEAKAKMSKARKGLAHLTDEQIANLRASHHTVSVRNLDTGEVFVSVKEAAEAYNLESTHITRVCKGKRKTTGGFRWCYEELQ